MTTTLSLCRGRNQTDKQTLGHFAGVSFTEFWQIVAACWLLIHDKGIFLREAFFQLGELFSICPDPCTMLYSHAHFFGRDEAGQSPNRAARSMNCACLAVPDVGKRSDEAAKMRA